ncbi:MAG: peptide deformylase [Campylobacter sp.]|uniref:peptide deformylase n=2 Tax=Campylobacter sp. TaxID=205 RepID=UPI002AA60A3B|nr:peptide deformylase [Campylobacter sp.]MCI6178749.1 peptide deformylase [Campylobacter sp.]
MIRKIITYPNPNLFKKSLPVESFDDELGALLDDMYDTMIASNGIGISAVQIDELKRVFLVLIPRELDELDEDGNPKIIQLKEDLIEIINPRFISKTGEQTYKEGCLSVPGYYEEVKRAELVELEFFDRYGKKQTLKADGLKAVCIQHEYDHLDGHLFIEKIGYTKRKKFDKEFKAALKKGKAVL